jgi:hypothetical protein
MLVHANNMFSKQHAMDKKSKRRRRRQRGKDEVCVCVSYEKAEVVGDSCQVSVSVSIAHIVHHFIHSSIGYTLVEDQPKTIYIYTHTVDM